MPPIFSSFLIALTKSTSATSARFSEKGLPGEEPSVRFGDQVRLYCSSEASGISVFLSSQGGGLPPISNPPTRHGGAQDGQDPGM